MTFKTIVDIRNHVWKGNHFADHQAMTDATRFALNRETSTADAIDALNIINVGAMGIEPNVNEENIEEVLKLERDLWNEFFTKDQL
jgi:hypothetical protein